MMQSHLLGTHLINLINWVLMKTGHGGQQMIASSSIKFLLSIEASENFAVEEHKYQKITNNTQGNFLNKYYI